MMSADADHFGARLRISFALLEHHDLGHGVVALAHQVGGLVHDLAAIISRGGAPHGEAFFGRLQRLVEIGFARMRQMAERLFRRRIEHILALAAVAAEPFAVDEEFEIAVHDVLAGLSFQYFLDHA